MPSESIKRGSLRLPALMVLVESSAQGARTTEKIVVAAIEGGATAIQLRDPATLPEDLKIAALEIRDVTRGRATFVVNDAAEIAIDLRLDGLHLPEAAFDIDRSLAPWPFLVGRSVHSVAAAKRAEESGCDYVVAGNIFETTSHPGRGGYGIEFLRMVAAAVSIPVLAVGGITVSNAAQCMAAGANGIVVRSGIVQAADPRAAAQRYCAALTGAA